MANTKKINKRIKSNAEFAEEFLVQQHVLV